MLQRKWARVARTTQSTHPKRKTDVHFKDSDFWAIEGTVKKGLALLNHQETPRKVNARPDLKNVHPGPIGLQMQPLSWSD